jgi:hypothetical protein
MINYGFFDSKFRTPLNGGLKWPFRCIQQDVLRVNKNISDISVRQKLSANCLYDECIPINAAHVIA